MESHQELMRIAHRSKCITTVVEDYEFLATLLSHLLPIPEKEPVRDKIFDTGPVKAADLQTLYKISEKCDNVWTAREGIDWLLFYLFYRRYGWEDVTFHRDKVQLFAPSMIQRLRISSRAEELRFYERVKSVASDLITWFEQNPLRLTSLKMMNSAIRIGEPHIHAIFLCYQ
ncbi:unnamed protein product [Dicrocoelium dendriticum]|nr:unnamed protein product [Dicrocoelium dendriticum]